MGNRKRNRSCLFFSGYPIGVYRYHHFPNKLDRVFFFLRDMRSEYRYHHFPNEPSSVFSPPTPTSGIPYNWQVYEARFFIHSSYLILEKRIRKQQPAFSNPQQLDKIQSSFSYLNDIIHKHEFFLMWSFPWFVVVIFRTIVSFLSFVMIVRFSCCDHHAVALFAMSECCPPKKKKTGVGVSFRMFFFF